MKKLLILLALSFALSGCTAKVSQTEYDALATEKAVLAERVEILTSENGELSSQVEELTTENSNLKEENQKLAAENAKLKSTPVPTAISESKNLNVDKSVSKSSSTSSFSSSSSASSGSSDSGSTQYAYIGNKNSYKFHRPSCSTLPSEANRIYYATREEAVNAGMVPCKRCNP